jgi:hypothetical protein
MKTISILLCTLLLAACASLSTFGERVSELNPGMSKQQVFEVVGKPDGFDSLPDGSGSVVKYIHRLVSGTGWQYTDYYLFFDANGRLASIKNGPVVDNTANVQNALNSYNANLIAQKQLQLQQNQQLINSLNQNRAQRVIICKPGDLMCY